MKAFKKTGPAVNIDVAATTANVKVGDGVDQVRVMNNGSATVWIEFGSDNTVEASATGGDPVPPGAVEVWSVSPYAELYVAAIAAAGTGKIYFTPGTGI